MSDWISEQNNVKLIDLCFVKIFSQLSNKSIRKKFALYSKSKVNSITYDKIYLDCEEKSQTALFIYCHAWQSRDMQLYLWR